MRMTLEAGVNENSVRTALNPDLETVAQVLTPVEDRESRLARRSQKRYRISELSLIVGAVVAVTLGAVAAASGADPQTAGLGTVWITLETALTFFLGSLASASISRHRRLGRSSVGPRRLPSHIGKPQ